jgi:hypothetical protein
VPATANIDALANRSSFCFIGGILDQFKQPNAREPFQSNRFTGFILLLWLCRRCRDLN